MPQAGTILVVGQAGQVARCLHAAARDQGVPLKSIGRPELDIADARSVEHALREVTPSVVINAAAYTAVDKAEAERDEAYRVNCAGPAILATAAAARNIPFIHISTDYVFDGNGSTPYREGEPTSPLGVYGSSKRDGEIEVMAAYRGAVIVRTSWVYSAHGANFLKTMMRLAESHPVVRVVNDQHGSPTSAHDLAPALLQIASRLSSSGANNRGGIYHLTAGGQTTWFGFAEAIFSALKSRGDRAPGVVPIPTTDYPTPAKRPAYSVLDCTRMERVFGVRLPPWRQSLDTCLDQFARQKEPLPC